MPPTLTASLAPAIAQPRACCGRGGCTLWCGLQPHRHRAWRGQWPGTRPLSVPLRLVSHGGRSSDLVRSAHSCATSGRRWSTRCSATGRRAPQRASLPHSRARPCPTRTCSVASCRSRLRPRCRTTPQKPSESAWREAARTAVHAWPGNVAKVLRRFSSCKFGWPCAYCEAARPQSASAIRCRARL